ncbi:MAG: biotin/lipoyl-binding protein [Anaerolineae bacterium]|nr:biotin/lipoyl-binding protein [Anaerolineae bacterium]
MRYQVEIEGRRFEIEVRPDGTVWVDGRPVSVDLEGLGGPFLSLLLGQRSYEAAVEEETGEAYRVVVAGRAYRTAITGPQAAPAATAGACPPATGPCEIRAPLPGLLVELRVVEGQQVEAGAVVAVIESMKMHLELRAPRAGAVCSLYATPGQEVQQGDVLAVIG